MSRVPVRSLAVVVVLLLMGWAWASGLHENLDLVQITTAIRAAGPLGALLFVAAFSFIQPLHISAYLFVISASLVWSPFLAIPLSWAGSIGSALVAFGFARFVGRDAVQRRIPQRYRLYDGKLEDSGLHTVIMLRLVFFTTPMVSFMLGVSRVRFRHFLLGTVIGYLPAVVIVTLAGDRVAAWFLGS